MNERINNLIEQSGFGSYAEIPDTYIVHKNDLVEFAELIVAECADRIRFCIRNDIDFIAEDIEKHFGVE